MPGVPRESMSLMHIPPTKHQLQIHTQNFAFTKEISIFAPFSPQTTPPPSVMLENQRFVCSDLPYLPPTTGYSTSSPSMIPPPLIYGRSPYCRAPLPPAFECLPVRPSHRPVHVNDILEFHTSPAINYDLSHQPHTATTRYGTPLSPLSLSNPATDPPVSSITLVSAALPWLITVSATPKPEPFVSVSDVLTALHLALRMRVTPDEFNRLPAESRHRVIAARERRCRALQDPRMREEERQRGLVRIDFLMGRNRFLGLSCTTGVSNVLELNVGA